MPTSARVDVGIDPYSLRFLCSFRQLSAGFARHLWYSVKKNGVTDMLAEQIAYLRIRAGMTQRKLAKELHIGLSAIGMYEQGRRTPSVEILIQMATFFGVSLDYLITGKEFSTPATERQNPATHPCPCRACCAFCKKRVINKSN